MAIAWAIGGAFIVAGALLGYWLHRTERPGGGVVFAVLAVAGYILSMANFTNGTRVLVMKGDDRGYVRSDLRLYGTATYTYADGRSENLRWLGARHIIINDTTRTLKLGTVRYGAGLTTTEEIAPFHRADAGGILDHFGPGDRPPAQSTRMELYWLHW